MKRVFSLLLCLVLLLLSFSGCTPKDAEGQLMVGFGRADITPDFSLPLQGYPGLLNRWFTNVLDPIHVTAIAFSDRDNNTVILLTYDLADCDNPGIGFGMRDISETFSLPRGNVMCSATHTHSAPLTGTTSGMAEYLLEDWEDLLREKTLEAATLAMEDRLPAEVYTASINTERLNFVRHYVLDDGSVVGDNFGDDSGKRYVRHVQDADNELQVLRFKREGGKDIILANYQIHPHRTGGGLKTDLSSDMIGPMTTYLESNLDCSFAYFGGAGGNIDPSSRIASENIVQNHIAHGEALGKYAILACSNMQKVDAGKVQILNSACTVDAVSGGSPTVDVKFAAFSIGDVGFVNVPYEMFCSNGVYVKENSPFQTTFVTTIAYNTQCYVPDAKTFAYDVTSYEETKCIYAEGCGEVMAEFMVDMLKQLHPTRK